jgi:hypothetical protein
MAMTLIPGCESANRNLKIKNSGLNFPRRLITWLSLHRIGL